MGDCLKERGETSYWFELFAESGIVSEGRLEGLKKEVHELIAIFVAIIKKTKLNQNKT